MRQPSEDAAQRMIVAVAATGLPQQDDRSHRG